MVEKMLPLSVVISPVGPRYGSMTASASSPILRVPRPSSTRKSIEAGTTATVSPTSFAMSSNGPPNLPPKAARRASIWVAQPRRNRLCNLVARELQVPQIGEIAQPRRNRPCNLVVREAQMSQSAITVGEHAVPLVEGSLAKPVLIVLPARTVGGVVERDQRVSDFGRVRGLGCRGIAGNRPRPPAPGQCGRRQFPGTAGLRGDTACAR